MPVVNTMRKLLIVLLCAVTSCSSAYAKWPYTIWDPLFLKAHHNWHPPFIPFPVVLVLLELGALILYQVMRRPELDVAAKYFLYLAAVSLIPVVVAGLHDVGVDQSPNNAIFAGLSDRVENFSNFKDPLSVHVFYAGMVDTLVILRLVWRRWFYDPEITAQRLVFLGSSVVLSWLVFAAAQVGGSMVYP
jgi:uncharacterized membrane protein